MAPGAVAVARAHPAQPEPEVGVVVHRVELDGLGELILPDQTYAFVRVGEGSRALDERGEGRVVKAGVPVPISTLLRHSAAKISAVCLARAAPEWMRTSGRKRRTGQRLGDPPRIGAAAFRQLARIIVASVGGAQPWRDE